MRWPLAIGQHALAEASAQPRSHAATGGPPKAIAGLMGTGELDARRMEDGGLFAGRDQTRLVEHPACGKLGVNIDDCAEWATPLMRAIEPSQRR